MYNTLTIHHTTLMYLYSVSGMVTGAARKCSLLLHTNKKNCRHSKKKQSVFICSISSQHAHRPAAFRYQDITCWSQSIVPLWSAAPCWVRAEADRNIKSFFDVCICHTYFMFAISGTIYILAVAKKNSKQDK